MTTTTWRYRLGPVTDIPIGEGRAYAVDGEQVAVFRLRGGAIHAVSAICPHAGGPLADGQVDETVILCPLHLNGWELATGRPTTGQPPISVYETEVDEDGYVVIHVPATN